jgi:asparagine synthase (glutamine-hydrolysing)
MCGIAGIVTTQPSRIVPWLELAANDLAHRGPDDEGYLLVDQDLVATEWAGPSTTGSLAPSVERCRSKPTVVGLAHRRLSIVEVSALGHQPMSGRGGHHWIVFNGEIYNHRELRQRLEGRGHRFDSGSDTEVLLAAYAEWGERCVERLVGMWAFALVDLERRRVVLSRDAFGIKPLYVATSSGRLAFASEIRPLLRLPWVDRTADPERVTLFLDDARIDDGTATCVRGVRQVPAASTMCFDIDDPGGWRVDRWWSPPSSASYGASFERAAIEIRDAFLRSVELHLRADVPVGACLSGGVDSSSIVAAMREVGGAGLDLRTFTYSAEGDRLDERNWARIAARRVAAVEQTVSPVPTDFRDDLDAFVASQFEPVASTSVYAQRRVMQSVRDNDVSVVLDGQGADELFAGYRSFRTAQLARAIARRSLPEALVIAAGLARTSSGGRTDLAASIGARVPRRRTTTRFAKLPPVVRMEPASSLHDDLVRALEVTSLPALLRYEDRNSMVFSIESRTPFLTVELAELALSQPETHLVDRSGRTKAVFRAAMRGIVPNEILDRRDKIGFETTQTTWLQHAVAHRLLDPRQSLARWPSELVDADLLAATLQVHRGGGDLGSAAWRAVSLCGWHEQATSVPTMSPTDDRRH